MTHARNVMRLYPDNWGIIVIAANKAIWENVLAVDSEVE